MLYRDYIQTLAPPWLLRPNGAAWLQAIGATLDDNMQRAREAAKAPFPLYAPSDALPVIGDEVGMPRGVVEPEASYRARLSRAWDLWPTAGTAWGILQAASAAGYPSVILQTQLGKQYSLTAAPTGDPTHDLEIASMPTPVHLGGTPSELWVDFKALITQPWPSWWGGSAPADGSPDQKAFAALLKAWKSAHARCVGLAVVSGPVWDSAITWAGASTWDSGTSVTWTPTN